MVRIGGVTVTERSVGQNAQLALLLEVSGTPKPGNVDREREYDDLRFEHFVAGAVGARPGLDRAAAGDPIGPAFEAAVEGMSGQSGGNTQFGALLVLTPLAAAAADGRLTPSGVDAVVRETTVEDAAAFYRAFEHVDVAVDDPPDGLEPLDVRRGSDAVPELRAREMTLFDVMASSADVDGVAAEWVSGFERVFDASETILAGSGPVADRASDAFLELLAADVDTFVVTRQDRETAAEVQRRAQAVLDGEEDATALAEEFVERDINPGTTADIVAGALFVALERGLDV
ncbi:triphosphoribosyl-dephospho-CoA synthase [Haloarcula taiwanensis]|uniref:Triphosphoribosyl-dephospho-CoA synthase n=1 Tax=Haloarcula taiwanensis TaxID=1932004 RepID=A0A2H4ZW78_9EURY|nr:MULTISPECIES: triphosphoribosyl-dephospho-CoA synthase [Haloarcula]AUG46723.1 triphosphoribosyl-dephospho-CoA synthase [Haloarcula taiwanensis]RLM36927.1 CitG domain-containing protein [Haloarcula sp. Atlit-120R]RLM44685.1 CitG domain-containing protein [Haloarcula sp. Atlit-47R]RLN01574.1 CitG domain-containing protein [Haloarcula sp. Atlit-7R]